MDTSRVESLLYSFPLDNKNDYNSKQNKRVFEQLKRQTCKKASDISMQKRRDLFYSTALESGNLVEKYFESRDFGDYFLKQTQLRKRDFEYPFDKVNNFPSKMIDDNNLRILILTQLISPMQLQTADIDITIPERTQFSNYNASGFCSKIGLS